LGASTPRRLFCVCRRYEKEDFQRTVRGNFAELKRATDAVDGGLWHNVDAAGSIEEVAARIEPLANTASARVCGKGEGGVAAPIRRLWDGAVLE
jgi:hypothetical protein